MDHHEIARELHAARLAASLTQDDLARSLGLSRASISNIERGKRRTKPEIVRRWMRVCGYDVEAVELDGGSPLAAALADTLPIMSDGARADLARVLRVWPRLSARERGAVMGVVAAYEA